jgi:hypothetical protein
MSESVTLPLNEAFTGPILRVTFACISVSEVFSTLSQPGMLARSTSGSLSAAQTTSRGAAIVLESDMSMG